ncbi:MAG: Smr/MutS family protein [Pseudomonadota bacterium]
MKKRGLTPEEQTLWRRAVRDVQRMRRESEDTLPVGDKTGLRSPEKLSPEKKADNVLMRKATTNPRAVPDPFAAGDPRADRKVARGRTPIDAVIDLHGHTQATARKTLLAFLINARLSDKRCVLVITGKGASTSRAFGSNAFGHGVLRSRLSDWLKEEPFREMVVRASPAHRKHGGGGAFYVFLKSRVRRKS